MFLFSFSEKKIEPEKKKSAKSSSFTFSKKIQPKER